MIGKSQGKTEVSRCRDQHKAAENKNETAKEQEE
jgi:hypothetical protein